MNGITSQGNTARFRKCFANKSVTLRFLGVIFLALFLFLALGNEGKLLAAAGKQRSFASPEAAVDALAKAIKASKMKELMLILGPDSGTLVASGDAVQDRRRREQFSRAYGEKKRLERGPDGLARLFIGKDDWPFPFPLVKVKTNWLFDTQAGKQEIFSRRIGANELNAIQVCLAILDAQNEYADLMRVANGQPEYAQKFEGTPGKRDGLYWETPPGSIASPLGPLLARARAEGYHEAVGKSIPFHGYLFRILKAQGDKANGGAFDYLIGGKLIGGFAVVAFPALYGSSGIQTFMVNHEGVVYRKDLGRETAEIVLAMTTFNPDATWKKVE